MIAMGTLALVMYTPSRSGQDLSHAADILLLDWLKSLGLRGTSQSLAAM